jgi:predicted amidohydrolase YtcJ
MNAKNEEIGMSTSRRQLIQSLAALPLMRIPGTDPDLVLYNGLIHTVRAERPEATAVAVRDGRILAVGADQEILALAGRKSRRLDLARRRVLPGFNDAHAHPWEGGL